MVLYTSPPAPSLVIGAPALLCCVFLLRVWSGLIAVLVWPRSLDLNSICAPSYSTRGFTGDTASGELQLKRYRMESDGSLRLSCGYAMTLRDFRVTRSNSSRIPW